MKLYKVPYRTEIEWIPWPGKVEPPVNSEVLVLTARGHVMEGQHNGKEWMTADDEGCIWPIKSTVIAWADQDNLTHVEEPPLKTPAHFVPGLPEDLDQPLNQGGK